MILYQAAESSLNLTTVILVLLPALAGGGLASIIFGAYKARAEKGALVITEKQGAVSILDSVIEAQRGELERKDRELERLRAENDRLRERLLGR